MLYLVGLGLDLKGISQEALEVVRRCKQIYLENYTVDFPYSLEELSEFIDKKIIPADREFIEKLLIVDEARKKDVALLVYGSPLTATTHIVILNEAKVQGIPFRIFNNASILDAVAESGLQLYKFGKITSMPAWKPEQNYKPASFIEIVKENISIGAHSLILIDIGLEISDAIKELKESAKEFKISLDKILICQSLGTKRAKIFYRGIDEFEKFDSVRKPYCIILPGKLHFLEEEILKGFERD